MKVILRETVEKLGKAGQMVEVKPGYARNYLLPRQLAVEATTKNVHAIEHQQRIIADKLRRERKDVEGFAAKLGGVSLSFPVQVGEEGKLFGSVTNKDIAEALAQQGIEIDKRKIGLEDPIKELGEYTVPVTLPHDVEARLKVTVVAAE
jgi:large subunit ribosomal protein L9